MDPITLNRTENPEAKIQREIIAFLTIRGWHVMPTHGNAHQAGFPDLYCLHPQYGQRWVEVKNPGYYKFTPAQIRCFPRINAAGVGIWIMIAADKNEYAKLFDKGTGADKGHGNWEEYHRRFANLGGRNLANRVK